MLQTEYDNRIEVICQFSREAEIIPIKIRLTDETGERQTYAIQSYKELMHGKEYRLPNGVLVSSDNRTFRCRILSFNKILEITIIYNSHDNLWRLMQ